MGNYVGNVVGDAAGNLVGNGLGNDAVFSLNMWLRMIYCLQTIHEPACVILTLFNILYQGELSYIGVFPLYLRMAQAMCTVRNLPISEPS